MHNGLAVHIIDSLAYLSYEENAIAFSQCEVVGNDSLEKFSACYAVHEKLDINELEFQWNFSDHKHSIALTMKFVNL